jgi:hypothetical protein
MYFAGFAILIGGLFAALCAASEGDVELCARRQLIDRHLGGLRHPGESEQPLGAVDYLAIAERYHTIILAGIPALSPERRDEAQRFNTLVDTLYEARTNLVASAEVPQRLYPGRRRLRIPAYRLPADGDAERRLYRGKRNVPGTARIRAEASASEAAHPLPLAASR